MKGSMDRRVLVCTSFAACLAPTLLLRLLSDSNFPSSPSTTSPLFQNTVRHTLSLNPTFQNVRPFQSGFEKSQRNERSTRITHRLGPNCPSCFSFQVPRPYPASGKGGLWKIDPQVSTPSIEPRRGSEELARGTVELTFVPPSFLPPSGVLLPGPRELHSKARQEEEQEAKADWSFH